MKSSSSPPLKIGLVLALGGVSVLLASSSNQGGRRVESRLDGQSRLISDSPMYGATCAVPPTPVTVSVPINPVTVALAMRQALERPVAMARQQAAAAPAPRAAGPSAAQKAAVAARKQIGRASCRERV